MKRNRVAVWRDALLLPGETDLIASGVRELAEYFGLSETEARRRCESALLDSKREWEAATRRTPAQIADFYRHTQSYLFEHIWWHAADLEANAVNVALLEYAQQRGAHSYLDFGSGVGANALLAARYGFRVTLADISRTMLDFARWRLQRRGLSAQLIDLQQDELPAAQFDFITAMDVMEHLADPAAELRRLSRALKPGAQLALNYRVGLDVERPMHLLTNAAPILRGVRQNGLRAAGREADEIRRFDVQVYERSAHSSLADWCLGAYDQLRYSRWLMADNTVMAGAGSAPQQVRHPQRCYFERLGQLLSTQTRWLDVGCGRQLVPWWLKGQEELEAALKRQTRGLVGIDPDGAAVHDNRSCDWRVQAEATALPFANDSFALVTSNMVFEHVEQPLPSLTEIRRVLQPGGRLLILTPNWLDLVTLAARVIPNRLHPALVSRLEARAAKDVYPTHFRFNRPRTIEQLLRQAGFRHWQIEPLEQPDSYAHVPLVSKIETGWHRLARRWPALRGTLLIEAE